MQKDERLLPLPTAVTAAASAGNLHTPTQQEYPTNYSPVYDDDATMEQSR